MRFVLSRCHNKLHLLIITNMEFAMNLKIVNDTIFDLNYYLVIDNKERCTYVGYYIRKSNKFDKVEKI